MLLSAYEDFVNHREASGAYECCGLLMRDKYFPCRNAHDTPATHFEIAPEDWDLAESLGPITAVCHSHHGSPSPSHMDVEQCKISMIPWYILGDVGALHREDPMPVPLVGRPFVYGWADCYSIVHDYFGDLPDFPREPEFWTLGHECYLENYAKCGFREVPLDEASVGDVVLMRVLTPTVSNHAAVIVEPGKIVHHLYGRYSNIEQLGPWLSRITHVMRRR